MAKKTIKITDIRTAVKNKKAIIGTKSTIKNLKLGKLSKVYLSSNCSETVKKDILYYAKLAKVEVVELPYPNEELGVLCKKPFSISVLSFLKQ